MLWHTIRTGRPPGWWRGLVRTPLAVMMRSYAHCCGRRAAKTSALLGGFYHRLYLRVDLYTSKRWS